MKQEAPKLRYPVGAWVKVHARRFDSPDIVLVGKVVEATRDYAIAECRTPEGSVRFTMSEDTASAVSFSRMQPSDFRRRRR